MRLFKRISSTVLASVDKVISEVENHSAVIESMLKELKSASSECKVRLNRVRVDGEKMEADLVMLKQKEQQWTHRAEKLANENDEVSQNKALACLERRLKTREQIKLFNERLKQHAVIKKQLQDQLQTIENRFSEINNQRHLLQSQQAIADANRVVASATGSKSTDINAALDRWEISIAKTDVHVQSTNEIHDVDELSMEFEESETKDILLTELEALKTDSKKHKNQI